MDYLGIDHVEFWVGNAKQAAYYYQHAFGFTPVAYAGPETGVRDRVSYVLRQNQITIVLTTALGPEGTVQDHVKRHGDGVRDVAFLVRNLESAHETLLARGAVEAEAPFKLEDETGTFYRSAVETYGDTIHGLVDRSAYKGRFMPNYVDVGDGNAPGKLGMIDHVVGNVGWDEMDHWVGRYTDIFGFHRFVSFDDSDISTEFTALRSVVVARPGLVGASELRPVGSAIARANLKETGVATAVGTTLDGAPVVVTCSTGVDLELVPSAADDRLTHAPDARLVLVVPTRDALPVTTELAAHLASPAEVVPVDDDWQMETTGAP